MGSTHIHVPLRYLMVFVWQLFNNYFPPDFAVADWDAQPGGNRTKFTLNAFRTVIKQSFPWVEDKNLNFQSICLGFFANSIFSSPDKCPLRKEKEKPKSWM